MAPQHPSSQPSRSSGQPESGFGYALSEKTSETDDQRIEEVTPLPPPESMLPWVFSEVWGGGYIGSLQARRGVDSRPGRGRSWIRTAYPLVEGETDPPVAAFAKLIDTANGLAVRADPNAVFFFSFVQARATVY